MMNDARSTTIGDACGVCGQMHEGTACPPRPTTGYSPTGWLCPRCGRVNAPFVDACPCPMLAPTG